MQRERGGENLSSFFLSSSYYRYIYTEQRTPRTKDTDKRKPIEEGGREGSHREFGGDLDLKVVEM